ncbi:MAG: phosphoenolpyruvate synthase/pyruvate phosphate dikinase, pyruvate, water dikinase [Candidatus Woesebacteria bacterium GW2011_GWC1_38_13]|uniref:Phosphoenolpyruvate synthase n=1 Tax=Candidatus Woesebacteria bacterium GW2011_GWC1_38_13 TaxID=1618583 RepID=A0A0G0LVT9_9BACT|nr:MAG: phosphoenolpyruvate synthase/pyruvate phosphate dikinase, pyruvate, water dikinase [Candidatus Woesebacteria bacterium GW2011_GWC1_38_13]
MTATAPKYNLFFKDIDKDDLSLVGGKGANLGEMTKAGFPVPYGFAVTTISYDAFLAHNNIINTINDFLKQVDVDDPDQLNSASKKIQKIVLESEIPADVGIDIVKYYKKLSGPFSKALVAVRSSATAEDLPGMSFAGQQATFLNIKGQNNLLMSVRECWASLFTPRAIFYRDQNKIPHDKVKISVIVQKMVQSEVSGVMFSINPVTNEKDSIVIESVWGLGEMIVQGSVVPDTYVVQKETFSILSKVISDQKVMLTRKGEKTEERDVPKTIIDKQKISDADIVKLAKISNALQKHYYFPQDSEWAYEKGKIYIVQTRPVTTIEGVGKKISDNTDGVKDENQVNTPILSGAAASPGIGTGYVKILQGPKEISKVKTGDVLVAKMTSPDYVPAMKKAVAIVTDEGGLTSHAAIVSRELGIPCVVGTKNATKTLTDNAVITVDGSKGLVYTGGKVSRSIKKKVEQKLEFEDTKTATKLYVNLAEPERAKEISKMNVQGVGLLRAEFMIANIGIHPKEAIQQKKQDVFISKLEKGLEEFTKAFSPRPVVYRATDFKTNEYRSLPGGEKWEPNEANPMLGFRGAYRYISHPEVFNLELQAMKNVRKKYKNLWMMIPFVRSPEELKKVRRLVATEGFFEDPTFKFWMMVEIPINVIMIDEFIKVGIDGVSIGSNDLTMLVTGTDRDNAEVSGSFNERSPAVMWSLRRVIKHCNRAKVTSSVCGQAPSTYDDFARKLVKYGVTSMSINPDAVDRVRGVIKQAEKDLAKGNI